MTNLEIAELFRRMAAAYLILNENRFKIIAYERAADSIEHATSEIKDLWDDNKLNEIPGIGPSISQHLNELFSTGHIKYFETVMKKVPQSLFPLLLIPGIGPKKAYKLVKTLHLVDPKTVVRDLTLAAREHKIAPIEGFGEKSEQDILEAIVTFQKGKIKENRMELPYADSIAQDIMNYLKKSSAVLKADALGSLRRQVATIGDIDISVATKKPDEVIKYFLTYPHEKIIEQGPTGASLRLHNGRQIDLRVQDPRTYGSMLQYFTGSKNHNIHLRTWALEQGLSLSEYGIKELKTGKTKEFSREEDFYKALKLPPIPPEIREDKGELEAALRSAAGKSNGLPKLVELSDIKGDLHIHTNYNLEPSHDLGAQPLSDNLDKAMELGYEYIGLSDHNPSITNHSEKEIIDIMKRRKEDYEHLYSSWIKSVHKLNHKTSKPTEIFIMCEADILTDGSLSLPEKALDYVDAIIASIHSSFNQDRELMTKRVLRALESHPKVRIFGHPTGRLLTKREGYELDWEKIFEVCRKRDIALEINAYPSRLDLPDSVVYDAVRQGGLKFAVNTDSHDVDHMDLMKFGVSVARRGWATRHDIVNTMEYNNFKNWLVKGA